MSGENRERPPATPVEAAIRRRNEEEARRHHHSWRAKAKFAGAALFGGLTATGAVLMGAGALEVSTVVEAAVEGVSTASAAGLFGSGLVELRQADDASRHSARLVQALAQQELAVGEFIGPTAQPPAPETYDGNGNGSAHGGPDHSITSQWLAHER